MSRGPWGWDTPERGGPVTPEVTGTPHGGQGQPRTLRGDIPWGGGDTPGGQGQPRGDRADVPRARGHAQRAGDRSGGAGTAPPPSLPQFPLPSLLTHRHRSHRSHRGRGAVGGTHKTTFFPPILRPARVRPSRLCPQRPGVLRGAREAPPEKKTNTNPQTFFGKVEIKHGRAAPGGPGVGECQGRRRRRRRGQDRTAGTGSSRPALPQHRQSPAGFGGGPPDPPQKKGPWASRAWSCAPWPWSSSSSSPC